MKDTCRKPSQVSKTNKGAILRTKTGKRSFVGLKRTCNTLEKSVEWIRHLYAYKYAERFAEGKSTLDVGAGVGYGVHELSTKASEAIGIDISKEAIYYSRRNYSKKTSFLIASGINLPFRGNSFHQVVSFQVIEHIDPCMVVDFLREIRRVLKNNGVFMVSTPNRRLRLLPFQKPWNPDHRKEYDATDLGNTLRKIFENVEILGLFATRDAFFVEYDRVKQNPFFVYVINPAIFVVDRILPVSLIDMLKRSLTRRKKISRIPKRSHNTTHHFSLKDFQTSRQKLKACIDLYGICLKTDH